MVSDHHFFCFSQGVLRELSRNPDFFKHDIAFILMVFLSFTSSIPYRQWPEQKAEYGGRKTGLQFATKGSKDLAAGPQLHLLVAITNGKGVVLEEVYEKMDGQFFTQFIRTHFNIAFARSGPKWHGQLLFIMDNDPCQQSKVAKRALVSGDKKTCCHICQQ